MSEKVGVGLNLTQRDQVQGLVLKQLVPGGILIAILSAFAGYVSAINFEHPSIKRATTAAESAVLASNFVKVDGWPLYILCNFEAGTQKQVFVLTQFSSDGVSAMYRNVGSDSSYNVSIRREDNPAYGNDNVERCSFTFPVGEPKKMDENR